VITNEKLDAKSMDALTSDESAMADSLAEVLHRLGHWEEAPLKALPAFWTLFKTGHREVALGFPVLDLAAGVHHVWQMGFAAGYRAAEADYRPGECVQVQQLPENTMVFQLSIGDGTVGTNGEEMAVQVGANVSSGSIIVTLEHRIYVIETNYAVMAAYNMHKRLKGEKGAEDIRDHPNTGAGPVHNRGEGRECESGHIPGPGEEQDSH